ncbi:hypothetical protein AWB83_02428 [Caballeronia ptereochthonis]|uniref:Uncharacterized protein n=1 Tax=Caballeronia ptereochthonis TaxID=1777144 RepID=A0A158AVE3_9BURK|nr:hypothetical protein AWB83_02428 [Caballeronia ptereochthonis]
MSDNIVSLRSLVDKWMTPTSASSIRFNRCIYSTLRHTRCVRAESLGASGRLAIFFFRHDDGSWRVFPPPSKRPMMRPDLEAN